MIVGVAALVLGFAWLYAETASGVFAEWISSPDASYGLVLAVVAVAVMWRRRHEFVRAVDGTASPWSGGCVLLGGLILFGIGQLGADIFLTRISLVAVLAGAVWFLAGWRAVRVITAPLMFLLVAVPLPALVVNAVTLPLQLIASRVAATMIEAAGIPVFRDGNILELPSTTLAVAQACSGLRSLISRAAIGGVLAWMHTGWARRLTIVLASVPIAIATNSLRIAVTAAACEYWSPRAAADPWHTVAGWLTFVVGVALLLQVPRWSTLGDRRARWRAQVVHA